MQTTDDARGLEYLKPDWSLSCSASASTARLQLKGLVLMTPYFIELNRADPMRAMMDRYGEVVRQLTGRYQAS
jgi:hypothetical protein